MGRRSGRGCIYEESQLFCQVRATCSSLDTDWTSLFRLAGDNNAGTPGGKMVHALRSMGSAAMNYTQVATGGLDLYWYVTTPVPLLSTHSFCREIGCWCVLTKSKGY